MVRQSLSCEDVKKTRKMSPEFHSQVTVPQQRFKETQFPVKKTRQTYGDPEVQKAANHSKQNTLKITRIKKAKQSSNQ